MPHFTRLQCQPLPCALAVSSLPPGPLQFVCRPLPPLPPSICATSAELTHTGSAHMRTALSRGGSLGLLPVPRWALAKFSFLSFGIFQCHFIRLQRNNSALLYMLRLMIAPRSTILLTPAASPPSLLCCFLDSRTLTLLPPPLSCCLRCLCIIIQVARRRASASDKQVDNRRSDGSRKENNFG